MAKKELNPTMRAAREQKKKDKARNKKQRQEQRDKEIVKKDPLELKREIAHLKGDIGNNTGMFEEREKNVKRSRVEFLESMLKKREAADTERAQAASQQQKQEPMFNLKGILPQSMRQGDALQIEDKEAGSDEEPSKYEDRQEGQGDGDGGRGPREWTEDAEDEDAAALGYFDPDDVRPTQQKDADGWVPPMPAEVPPPPAELPAHLISHHTAAAVAAPRAPPQPMVRRFEVCEADESDDDSQDSDAAGNLSGSAGPVTKRSESGGPGVTEAVAAAVTAKLPPGVGKPTLVPPGPPVRSQQQQLPGAPLQPQSHRPPGSRCHWAPTPCDVWSR